MEKGVLIDSYSYHNNTDGLNASVFKNFIDSLHKLDKTNFERFLLKDFSFVNKSIKNNRKATPAVEERFLLGDVLHGVCLENHKWDDIKKDMDVSRYESVQKNVFIYRYDAMIQACQESWDKYGFFNKITGDYRIENVYFGSYLDQKLKAKIDFVGEVEKQKTILDFKTVASEDSIQKNISTYHYWYQLLFYNYVLDNEYKELVLLFICKDSGILREVRYSDMPKEEREKLENLFLIYLEYFYQYSKLFSKFL